MQAKTMSIPTVLTEAAESGYITQESLDALECEKLKAAEEIENLRRLYKEQLISCEILEAGIRGVQRRMQEKILALNI